MYPEHYQQINPSVLFEAAGTNLSSFRDLSRTFLAIAPDMATQLEAAVVAADHAASARASHALKGTTMLVGAAQLTSLLQAMEHRSRLGVGDGNPASMLEVTQLLAIVMQEVQTSIIDFAGAPQPQLGGAA